MTRIGTVKGMENILKSKDREEAYYELVELYLNGSSELRKEIRENWDYGLEWRYPNQKRLACSQNEKRSSKERILASLAYDSIENFQKEEPRDKLVALAVIYHSCIEAGLNPVEFFEKIASVSSEKVASFLRRFTQRRPEDRSKEAFMLTRIRNSDGEVEIFPSWVKK